jgi:hypothetical protein
LRNPALQDLKPKQESLIFSKMYEWPEP